jgi:photosystem II stability/assembly factor-like uncharacterized protein
MKNMLVWLTIVFTFIFESSTLAEPLDNWYWRNPLPQGNPLNGIVYANDSFITVGDAGTILTSTDNGITWLKKVSGVIIPLNRITYGNNTFVAVGDYGTVLTSTDNGNTWTKRLSETTIDLNEVAFANNTFVTVGTSGKIFTSNDNGVTWTSRWQ